MSLGRWIDNGSVQSISPLQLTDHRLADRLMGIVLGFVIVFALVAVWLERKISAFAQDRWGPMETGGWGFQGWLQTLADALKLILKKTLSRHLPTKRLFKLAPYIVFCWFAGVLAVIPFGANLIGKKPILFHYSGGGRSN